MYRLGPVSRMLTLSMLSAVLCAAQQAAPAASAGQAPATPQQDSQSQPAAPYGPLFQTERMDGAAPVTAVPDNRPISGILGLTLGIPTESQNTFTSSFRVGQIFDSNQSFLGTRSDYTGATLVGGTLGLQRTSLRRQLNIQYTGDAVVYDATGDVNSYHQLNIAQSFTLGRWTLVLSDNASYAPETSPATLGFTGMSPGGSGLASLNSSLTPNQSIFTPLSSRLSNAAGAEVQYGFSPRSSWTASATYGNLYFPDGELGNTHQIVVRSGYNRNLTPSDTISVFYDYGAYRGDVRSHADAHSVQFGYARRVTGRWNWSANGGPQWRTQGLSDDVRLSWAASTSLEYQHVRYSANLNYQHSLSAGEGILGSTSLDSLQLGLSRRLGVQWILEGAGGVSRNVQLIGATEFRSGFASGQLHRRLGERAGLSFSYVFQRQLSDGGCSGAICSAFSRQVFGIGFNWSPRPHRLR